MSLSYLYYEWQITLLQDPLTHDPAASYSLVAGTSIQDLVGF